MEYVLIILESYLWRMMVFDMNTADRDVSNPAYNMYKRSNQK